MKYITVLKTRWTVKYGTIFDLIISLCKTKNCRVPWRWHNLSKKNMTSLGFSESPKKVIIIERKKRETTQVRISRFHFDFQAFKGSPFRCSSKSSHTVSSPSAILARITRFWILDMKRKFTDLYVLKNNLHNNSVELSSSVEFFWVVVVWIWST